MGNDIKKDIKKIKFREAVENDCELLWKWRNDDETRKFSFNEKFIPLDEHKNWFYDVLNNPNTKIYIVLNEKNKPIGQIRLNLNNNEAEINISIDREERGRGYGTEALKLISEIGFYNLKLNKLIGYIKENNKKSIYAFEKSGFLNNGLKVIKGYSAIEMVLEKK